MLLTWPRLRTVAAIAHVAVCCLLLQGCGEKQKIGRAAAESMRAGSSIQQKSEAMTDRLIGMRDELALPSPNTASLADSVEWLLDMAGDIRHESVIVQKQASGIQDALPGVENKGGLIDTILMILWWAFLIGCGVAIVVILERLGLAPILRKLLAWIPWLIPEPKQKQANLAVKVIDPEQPEDATHLVAALRSHDPVFDAAFERQKKLIEREQAGRLLAQASDVKAMVSA